MKCEERLCGGACTELVCSESESISLCVYQQGIKLFFSIVTTESQDRKKKKMRIGWEMRINNVRR